VTYVTVNATFATGAWGCSGFMGQMWAVFERSAQGRLQLVSSATDPGTFVPQGAVVIGAGPAPAFIGSELWVERMVRAPGASNYAAEREIRVPFHDCGC
jgi:hypothetical protein